MKWAFPADRGVGDLLRAWRQLDPHSLALNSTALCIFTSVTTGQFAPAPEDCHSPRLLLFDVNHPSGLQEAQLSYGLLFRIMGPFQLEPAFHGLRNGHQAVASQGSRGLKSEIDQCGHREGSRAAKKWHSKALGTTEL